jgi:hypothetical protein
VLLAGVGPHVTELTGQVFVVTGRDEHEIRAATIGVKNGIALYASTPAYRAVLELHDMGDVQPELTALSTQGRWSGMALRDRWGDVPSAVSLYALHDADPGGWPLVARDGVPRHQGPSSTIHQFPP